MPDPILTATIASPFGDLTVVCRENDGLFIWGYPGQGRCPNVPPATTLDTAKTNFVAAFDAPGEPVWVARPEWERYRSEGENPSHGVEQMTGSLKKGNPVRL